MRCLWAAGYRRISFAVYGARLLHVLPERSVRNCDVGEAFSVTCAEFRRSLNGA